MLWVLSTGPSSTQEPHGSSALHHWTAATSCHRGRTIGHVLPVASYHLILCNAVPTTTFSAHSQLLLSPVVELTYNTDQLSSTINCHLWWHNQTRPFTGITKFSRSWSNKAVSVAHAHAGAVLKQMDICKAWAMQEFSDTCQSFSSYSYSVLPR